jgi:hypothetical protein
MESADGRVFEPDSITPTQARMITAIEALKGSTMTRIFLIAESRIEPSENPEAKYMRIRQLHQRTTF